MPCSCAQTAAQVKHYLDADCSPVNILTLVFEYQDVMSLELLPLTFTRDFMFKCIFS